MAVEKTGGAVGLPQSTEVRMAVHWEGRYSSQLNHCVVCHGFLYFILRPGLDVELFMCRI